MGLSRYYLLWRAHQIQMFPEAIPGTFEREKTGEWQSGAGHQTLALVKQKQTNESAKSSSSCDEHCGEVCRGSAFHFL